ncbi:MAG: hypothetical protein ACSHXW_07495 [Yoonia sp.]
MFSIIRPANLADRGAIYQLHLKPWRAIWGNELSRNILETEVPDAVTPVASASGTGDENGRACYARRDTPRA